MLQKQSPCAHFLRTLLFLKPHESLSRWDVLVLKTSFFVKIYVNLLFFLFSVVPFFMMFLSLVFNKTPVIAQRLSPPFFCKKRVIFQKTHIFQLFIFASSFFRFFCFFMFFGMCFKKHLFHPTVGPLGLSLRPNLATARASEGQSPACFPCFWRFSLFQFVRLFSVLPSIPLGPKWHPKATVCSPMAASRPQNANKRYKDDPNYEFQNYIKIVHKISLVPKWYQKSKWNQHGHHFWSMLVPVGPLSIPLYLLLASVRDDLFLNFTPMLYKFKKKMTHTRNAQQTTQNAKH